MDNLVRRFRKWRERRRQIKTNKELCQRYPFLIPWHRFTGELSVDRSDWKHPRAIPPYDWSYTELDNMPEGWFKRFGIQMCEEIRDALIEDDDLERYRVVQLKEKYGCYDAETEVLTKDGWKLFENVTMEDEFATLDEDGETLIYQRPTDIIHQEYSGPMYHLENRGVNFLVTPNHNMYVAKGSYYYHDRGNQKMTYPFELTTPDTYFGKDKRFKKGAKWIGNNPYGDTFHIPGYQITNWMEINKSYRTYCYDGIDVPLIPWLKFLGFYVAEGCTSVCKDNYGHQIRVAYNPNDEEKLVCDLLEGINVSYNSEQYGCKKFYNTVIGRWLLENCGHKAPNKKVPPFIKELPPDLITIFLQYLYIGDGHRNETSNVLTTTSKQLCDDVCELLIKAGYSFRYSIRPPRHNHKPWYKIKPNAKYPSYEINWLKLTEVEIDNSKHPKSFIEQYEPYDGMVHCVTVPSHILYVRRGGKGVWCGNSLRWYDNGTKIGSRVPMIIDKYSRLSERTCIHCGKPATQITLGWISPYCDDCCPEFGAIPIEEYFMEDEKKDDAGTD